VVRALGDERRSQLLALSQEVFDAVSTRMHREPPAVTEPRTPPAEIDLRLTLLRRALLQQDEALLRSMTLAAGALREDERRANAGLREAQAEVEAQIEALRDRDHPTALDRDKIAQLLSEIASGRMLVEAQLRIEAWIADWQKGTARNDAG
jgi:hypothetical protein